MSSFPALAIIQQHPIVNTIILIPRSLKHLRKELSKEVVVWILFKAKFSNIIHIDREFL
jgi:hypothetical protein